jgi:hypothetical protein
MPKNWRGRFDTGPRPIAPLVETVAQTAAVQVEDDSLPFPCSLCEKEFTSQRGLSRHTTEKHPAEDPALD